MGGEFELVNLILDFEPGAATPPHTHGGPGIVTVLEGEIVFGVEGKSDQVAGTGGYYFDLPGTVHTAANKSSAPARVSFLIALPKGAALTTVMGGASPAPQAQQQATPEHLGMPHTGATADNAPLVPMIFLAALAVTLTLLGAGLAGLARLSGAKRRQE